MLSSVQSPSRVRPHGLCKPMDCSTLGFPVHHQLPELAQTHVHQVSDAIQPSHPLSSLSPPAFNLSQHRGLFQHGIGINKYLLSIKDLKGPVKLTVFLQVFKRQLGEVGK